jgi:hypothetical protein
VRASVAAVQSEDLALIVIPVFGIVTALLVPLVFSRLAFGFVSLPTVYSGASLALVIADFKLFR